MNAADTAIAGEDARRARILEGAMQVFLAYGYQRTTMDDIARAAGISRPALYLLFRNKTDIYRAISTTLLENSAQIARRALSGDGTLAVRLEAAIEDCMFAMMANFAQSPHGAEILDMKNSLAADIVARWRDELSGLIGAAIAGDARDKGLDLSARGLSPDLLSALLLDGLEGMKARVSDPGEQRRAARGLIRLVELALEPRAN